MIPDTLAQAGVGRWRLDPAPSSVSDPGPRRPSRFTRI